MENPVSQFRPSPTLDDCAQEPIHIPGAIQPHGLLLAFEDDTLFAWSANVPERFSGNYQLGHRVIDIDMPTALSEGLSELFAEARLAEGFCASDEILWNGERMTRLVHRYDGRDIVEFERIVGGKKIFDLSSRLLVKLRSNLDIVQILSLCTEQIRSWTGFDRVMAYVFQPDGSGDVVAESRGDNIDSFLNMRFPASDIPAQARRLYTLNPLRLIPDVDYEPVALLAREGGRPIDLSFTMSRSVSPIHLEYLRNMGVSASMSVSIVVNGSLWGLLACHHYSPLFVGDEVRRACETLGHFVSSRVQAIEAGIVAERLQEGTETITSLTTALASVDDPLAALGAHQQALCQILKADALILTAQGKIVEAGGVPRDVANAILSYLAEKDTDLFCIDALDSWPESMRPLLGTWVGALDIVFDRAAKGRIVALRRAEVHTVRWGGQPEKEYKTGPNGPRLTPRGSFAEWRETVRGRCRPWLEVTLRVARQLQHDLTRVSMAKHAEIESARQHLLAMLGHDLRDPLQAIRMAANVLKLDNNSREWGTRIDNSSGRMQRLITQILDFSRTQAGIPLTGEKVTFDLSELLLELIDEAHVAHPGVEYRLDIERPAVWKGNPERIAQALSNLLSNARHHGKTGLPIDVTLRLQNNAATIAIANVAAPISSDVVDSLFVPYKPRRNPTVNRSGLGLGLYIASEIAKANHGELVYDYRDDKVIFTLRLNAVAANTEVADTGVANTGAGE